MKSDQANTRAPSVALDNERITSGVGALPDGRLCDHQSLWAEHWPDGSGYIIVICHHCSASGDEAQSEAQAIESFAAAHGGRWQTTAQTDSGADRHGHCDGYTFARRVKPRGGDLARLPDVLRGEAGV